MEKICLDTGFCLDFLRGDKSTVEKLKYYADREEICISDLTVMQLLASLKKTGVLSDFLNNITVISMNRKAANLSLRLIHEQKDKGVDPDIESTMLAAVCMTNHAFLITKERAKFEGIRGLKLV